MAKKGRKRVAKEERRNLRLWAVGARESVLAPHIPAYTDSLDRNWRDERDYLQTVCNEFHARISWRLQDHDEPDLPLPQYDPRAPAPVEDLDEEETQAKRARVELLNGRIRRWLKYRARKLRKSLRPKLDPRKDPWAILLAKLSGFQSPPKARQAYQQFMREVYQTDIGPVVAERWAAQAAAGSNVQTAKEPTGAFRAEIARELFAKLPEDQRDGYQQRAKQEAGDARKTYEGQMKNPPSRSPEDRQKCIDSVGNFLGPILQGILERTGLHAVVLLGGPIPKYGGELKTVYVSYGRNKTVGGQHFPQWAGERWDRQVTDLMKEYLETAFSANDIAEAALADPLDAAKYTIDKEENSDDELDSSSDDSSDSNADSDDTDAPPKKKRKKREKKQDEQPESQGGCRGKKGKKTAPATNFSNMTMEQIIEKTLTGPGITVTTKSMAPTGLTYTQMREWNIARNKILLEPLQAEIQTELTEMGMAKKTAAPAKRRGTHADEEAAVPRKSRRLNPEETGPPPTAPATSASTQPSVQSPATPPATQPTPPSTPPVSTQLFTQPAPMPPLSTPPASTQPTLMTPPVLPTPALATPMPTPPVLPTPALTTLTPTPPVLPTLALATPTPAPPVLPTPALAIPTPMPPVLPTSTLATPTPTPPVLPTPALATPTPTPPVLTHPATEPQPAPANLTARKSKGQRKGKGEGGASDPTPGETVELPANAPRWLVDNIAWLSTHDLGCHYTSLLAALVKLETTFGFKEDTYGTLPSEHRPLQVHDWIRSGRTRAKKILKVLDVEKYADEWQRWWDSLQPEWRRRGPDKKWRAGGDATYGGNEEWGVLDRPGPNGCLSVVGSLYFWGVCEDQSTGVKERWLDAVQDVVWMLEGLTASME